MKKFLPLVFAVTSAFQISPAISAPNVRQRVEVPVYFQQDRPFLYVTIGSSEPLQVGIDTGAGGLRIWQENLKLGEIKRTGIPDNVMYGSGKTGLSGEIVKGKVRIGDFALPGKAKFQMITGHICKDGARKRCEEQGSRRGFAGTIGLRTFHFSEKGKNEKVINPLIESGPFPYILKVARPNEEKGILIINPTSEEKSHFVRVRVSAGNGQRLPVCINRHCFDAILDTGRGANDIPYNSPKEFKALNLPSSDDRVVDGTRIPITIGTGTNSVSFEATAGKGQQTGYHLKSGENGILGVNTFRYLDVLYDFEGGIIGVAKKN